MQISHSQSLSDKARRVWNFGFGAITSVGLRSLLLTMATKAKKEAVSGDRKKQSFRNIRTHRVSQKRDLKCPIPTATTKNRSHFSKRGNSSPHHIPNTRLQTNKKKSPPHIFLSLRMLWAFINFSFSFLVRKSAHVWDPICLLPPPRNEKKSPFFILSCAPGWDNSSTR